MAYMTLALGFVTLVIGIVGSCGPGHDHTPGSRAFSFALGAVPAVVAGYYAVPLGDPGAGLSIAIIAVLLAALGFQRLVHHADKPVESRARQMGQIK